MPQQLAPAVYVGSDGQRIHRQVGRLVRKVKQGKEKDVKEMLLKQPSLATDATDEVCPPLPLPPDATPPPTFQTTARGHEASASI